MKQLRRINKPLRFELESTVFSFRSGSKIDTQYER